jgi:probable rRNA maturation factor
VEVDVTIQLQSLRWKTLLRPYCKTVRLACHAAIESSKIAAIPCQWEMAVVLADDAFIRGLNKTYRGHDKPTNVLSFPSVEHMERNAKRVSKGANSFELGDVVLALETVEREAQQQNKSFKHHALHLLVHGTLHLLGYDHELDKDATKMEKLEVEVLKKLGLSNPYL